jgi:hypothetical protein
LLSELFVFVTPLTFLAKELRDNTRFCFKLGNIPTETCEMLQTGYGDEGSNRSFVIDCFKQFKDERKDREDDP